MERMISQNRVEVIPSDFIMKCVKSNLFVIKGCGKRCGMSRRDCNANARTPRLSLVKRGRSKQYAHTSQAPLS